MKEKDIENALFGIGVIVFTIIAYSALMFASAIVQSVCRL